MNRQLASILALVLVAACGGPVVEQSAGAADAAGNDGTAAAVDAGSVQSADAGGSATGADAGTAPGADAGTVGAADAGSVGAADSGTPAADAGTATADAGTADAGSTGAADAGGAGDAGMPSAFPGFPDAVRPWAAVYGPASNLDLARAGKTFQLIDLDADPAAGNYQPADIARIRAGGAKVISYLNLGSCEHWRSYWTSAPAGFVSCGANRKAWRGLYDGYPDETWMNVGDPDYQNLMVNYVAPLLVEMGVDGFFLDNLEMVEHGTNTANGPCDAACSQGGLDLVRKLREKYPQKLIIMQNATSDVTRLGTTGGLAFPSILDGISHEEVFAPAHDAVAEAQLRAWHAMNLKPRGQAFWITTEDYVNSCTNAAGASAAYSQSLGDGFHPYATDASAQQQSICYWGF